MRLHSLLMITLTLLACTSARAAWEPAPAGSKLGAVTGGDFTQAQEIIEKKCTACHSSDRIKAAQLSGKNMLQIQQVMEKKGAKLTNKEYEVLGIFWKQTPLKNIKKTAE